MQYKPVELYCIKCGKEGFYPTHTSYPVCSRCQKNEGNST